MTSDADHLLIYLVAFCVSSLEKSLFRSFVQFLNWVICLFFATELYDILDVSFSSYMVCIFFFFSYSTGFLFTSLIISFFCAIVFSLIEDHLFVVCFANCALAVVLKTNYQPPCKGALFLGFLLRISWFQVLYLSL